MARDYKYRYVGGESPFECAFPGCGRQFTTEGGLILHYRIHLPKKEKPTAGGSCLHSWRLLSESNELERRAIRAGFTRVCQSCGEVER